MIVDRQEAKLYRWEDLSKISHDETPTKVGCKILSLPYKWSARDRLHQEMGYVHQVLEDGRVQIFWADGTHNNIPAKDIVCIDNQWQISQSRYFIGKNRC